MSAAGERNQAIATARVDVGRALALAEKVSDPWFRCQALAEVARHVPERDLMTVIERAVKAARQAKDSYQRVAVTAWPLATLIERGKPYQARRLLASQLEEAERIDHPVCRADALADLWFAAEGLDVEYRRAALDALLSACQAANSWRAGRIMRAVALTVSDHDPEEAQRIVNSMRDSPYKRTAQRRLDARRSR